ncbi:DEAD/DEAH box helicase [Bradyrhizobium sp. NBAIM20]|uniref:DEAD/DEAH box helicase n=1 Tax=unclassified Bradyrhizobium TaxID=2631580 RepID=UPI001CD4D648|nr:MULTISPECIES: DEAD/DEAH box helicase [unclassified Bradyrhizobium]MCA1412673.1 DEAD/DEAH box helicase [Bradyrhizobium sp. NBAIM20]MCA1463477.1 DEAD/DEAH box helicase [Bradyrhizobium sp. NBAIM18]
MNVGTLIRVRSSTWKVTGHERRAHGNVVSCRGMSGLVKGKTARFVVELEDDYAVLDPAKIALERDHSAGFLDTKLFLESAFRSTPTTTSQPLTLGKAAIDDLAFQHVPVKMALAQDRVRLLIADDVGLGKTLEAGLITSELILRGRAERILVVTTRAMLAQFQKEFWTRFSIPLSRLDSAAIRRMRNQIPAHYNVFDQFDRSIVSIDTLKQDSQIRAAIEQSSWDLIIIDEAHNAAKRVRGGGNLSLRSKLAKLLSRKADSLLLLTATPHDGSRESFASLIEMLDPTRVPDPEKLHRDDIEDLVIRRFRTSPEVLAALGSTIPPRELHRRGFPLSEKEEAAYTMIAELKLDLDMDAPASRAIDLFRTTLAKAIFSSPAACLETVRGRIARIERGTGKGSETDKQKLSDLAELLTSIEPSDFRKYQDFLQLVKDIKWTGKDPRDRLVVFSERIRTLAWLEERLTADLGLSPEMIGRVDGASVEADVKTQQVLEDFGQERSPLRILLASDMASEGLNLHFQSHRLVHFDLPWSLLRFQQRNGRIDRYGQDRPPQIYYFVGESRHPKVRDMWVLEKLVEKDQAAQDGVGDPAVFLGAGDVEREEEVVARAVSDGRGAETFAGEMDQRAANASRVRTVDDEFDALFGDYQGVDSSLAAPTTSASRVEMPPRLFPDTFAYTEAMLQRLAEPNERVFDTAPDVDQTARIISLPIPGDMMSDGGLGYSRTDEVDDRYMPVEAVGKGGTVELSDRADVINTAIAQAKTDERSWPHVQYLWDGHPILDWFGNRAETFFPEMSAPLCNLRGRLAEGEVAVILHGAVPNELGAPVVDCWAAVTLRNGRVTGIEQVSDFVARTGLSGSIPNKGKPDEETAARTLAPAVDAFQSHLVKLRKERQAEIETSLDATLERLAGLEARFRADLDMKFADVPQNGSQLTIQQRRQKTRRQNRAAEIDTIFADLAAWHSSRRRIVDDPNPFVAIKAVFVG